MNKDMYLLTVFTYMELKELCSLSPNHIYIKCANLIGLVSNSTFSHKVSFLAEFLKTYKLLNEPSFMNQELLLHEVLHTKLSVYSLGRQHSILVISDQVCIFVL